MTWANVRAKSSHIMMKIRAYCGSKRQQMLTDRLVGQSEKFKHLLKAYSGSLLQTIFQDFFNHERDKLSCHTVIHSSSLSFFGRVLSTAVTCIYPDCF